MKKTIEIVNRPPNWVLDPRTPSVLEEKWYRENQPIRKKTLVKPKRWTPGVPGK